MKRPWVYLVILVLGGGSLVGLTGCATGAKPNPQAFETAVKDIWVQYSNYWMAGDVNRWIQLWDEGGVQLPPNSPMKMSVAEIQKSAEAGQAAYKWTTFVIKISGSFVDETYGFVYGTYIYTFVPRAGGAELTGDGKYETIFKKQANGSWKIFRDCFNSNLP